MLDNVNKISIMPESSGEGIGKGIQSIGQGIGYLVACVGDRIKYGISRKLFIEDNKSTILNVAKELPLIQEKPKTLLGAIQYQEEENLRIFIKNIVEETISREENNIPLPESFQDTDNLLAIQKCAAETSDDDFSKLWARIFVEEATNPNAVDKKTINILKVLDKDVALFLQKEILPYTSMDGRIIRDFSTNYDDFRLQIEYGIITPQLLSENKRKEFFCFTVVFDSFYIMLYNTESLTFRILTSSGLKIQNILKIKNTRKMNSYMDYIATHRKSTRVKERCTFLNKKIAFSTDVIIINANNAEVLAPEDWEDKSDDK